MAHCATSNKQNKLFSFQLCLGKKKTRENKTKRPPEKRHFFDAIPFPGNSLEFCLAGNQLLDRKFRQYG